MPQFPPRPEAVAHWLLTHEGGNMPHVDGRVTAADRVHAQLRTGLVVFLGPTGFDSLWARAQHLAHPSVAASTGGAAIPPDPPNADDAQQAVLARFIALLFTFVGAALGLRLLRQSWPALPLDAADLESSDDAV